MVTFLADEELARARLHSLKARDASISDDLLKKSNHVNGLVKHAVYYKQCDDDVIAVAAEYIFKIIRLHLQPNGNKRWACYAFLMLLCKNNVEFKPFLKMLEERIKDIVDEKLNEDEFISILKDQ